MTVYPSYNQQINADTALFFSKPRADLKHSLNNCAPNPGAGYICIFNQILILIRRGNHDKNYFFRQQHH
jgi:hypothetical protein